MKKSYMARSALVLAILAGCKSTPTVVADQYVRYRCGGGQEIGVTIQGGGERALLERGGRSDLLRRVTSGSGTRYSDGKTAFWSKGGAALVEVDGQIALRDCAAVGSR